MDRAELNEDKKNQLIKNSFGSAVKPRFATFSKVDHPLFLIYFIKYPFRSHLYICHTVRYLLLPSVNLNIIVMAKSKFTSKMHVRVLFKDGSIQTHSLPCKQAWELFSFYVNICIEYRLKVRCIELLDIRHVVVEQFNVF